jgi:hypothetical protein
MMPSPEDPEMIRENRRFIRSCLVLLVGAFFAFGSSGSGHAQTSVRVQFAPGTTGTVVNGTISGREYIDYIVDARAGQTITVALSVTATNGNGSIFYNILPAGQGFPALYNGSTDDDRRTEVTLPETGDWAIRVYLMGNDRDAGRTVGYSIDIFIAPSGGSSDPGGSGAVGTARVTGVPANDVLNVRNGPGTGNGIVGALANGDTVRVLGCQDVGASRWCEIEMMTDMRERGWVNARFLSGGAASATPLPGAPSGLPLFGDGYPNPGDPCRRVGESPSTSRYLDDASDLVACPPSTDAGLFVFTYGATEVDRIDGWMLFSVPRR